MYEVKTKKRKVNLLIYQSLVYRLIILMIIAIVF